MLMQGKDKLGARSHTCVTRDRTHARARMRILGHTARIRGNVAIFFKKNTSIDRRAPPLLLPLQGHALAYA